MPAVLRRWFDSIPHPALACEIAPGYVAAARGWQFGFEALPAEAVAPSPVELNFPNAGVVRSALQTVLNRIGAKGSDAALFLPDQVIRVFLLHFDTFPRRAEEAIPLLRWRLKKSVPFDAEETVVSYMPQPLAPRETSGVSILAAVARQKVIRQYEELAEALSLRAGVVLSSTLASLCLLADDRPTLLARLSGRTLTTVIVRGEALCVYRCNDLAGDSVSVSTVMEELYPAVAFFQDTWRENLADARISGFAAISDTVRRTMESELSVRAYPLLSPTAPGMPAEAKPMIDRQLDALAGWAAGGKA